METEVTFVTVYDHSKKTTVLWRVPKSIVNSLSEKVVDFSLKGRNFKIERVGQCYEVTTLSWLEEVKFWFKRIFRK